MANPQNPVISTFPVPPPVFQLPFIQTQNGYLTPTALEFLQILWAAIQGAGGIIDIITIEQPGGATIGPGGATSIANEAMYEAMMRAYTVPREAPGHRFGVNFSKSKIESTTPSAVMGRAPSPINWRIPAGNALTWGKVDVAPSADTAFGLQVDGTPVGTVTWQAGQTTPVCAMATTTYLREEHDYLDLVAPASFNGMSGAFGLAVIGEKSA